jgi:hypothetical protein
MLLGIGFGRAVASTAAVTLFSIVIIPAAIIGGAVEA